MGNAVAALMGSVCSRSRNRTIDPWLRSRPMSLPIAPTSLVGLGLARVEGDQPEKIAAFGSSYRGAQSHVGAAEGCDLFNVKVNLNHE
ncbi:hypothetical protein ACS73_15705 [Pseudomonas lini]|nr:hypothetical protein ACS73_15705 [Pseudomonas lini]